MLATLQFLFSPQALGRKKKKITCWLIRRKELTYKWKQTSSNTHIFVRQQHKGHWRPGIAAAGSLSRDHTASKDALRAKLNKNPVKYTRAAISGSKWTQHILCQGHSFCFWHFGFLEVESLHFLRNFTFVIHIFIISLPLQRKEGMLLTVAKSWKLSSLVLLLGINPSFNCDNYANGDISEALCCLRPNFELIEYLERLKFCREEEIRVWEWTLILYNIWIRWVLCFLIKKI